MFHPVPATVSILVDPPPTGLIITPVWDSTITSNPSAAPLLATIDQAPLTVTLDNQTRVYGSADPGFTVSYAGFVLGQTQACQSTNQTARYCTGSSARQRTHNGARSDEGSDAGNRGDKCSPGAGDPSPGRESR